ncbi:MAG: AmmeMemoRadiSam system protein B [Lentisphaeria bacterium]|nr:AmmeMemoRadiSam system protein B [Lentisphaeria bacterium]
MSASQILASTIAGSWYPGDPVRLKAMIDSFLAPCPVPEKPYNVIVVPHAGYPYSGPTAGYAYAAIDRENIRRVILLAPSHRYGIRDLAVVPMSDAVSTPLGTIPLDTAMRDALLGNAMFRGDDGVHRLEHSTQIQYPFLQHRLGDFRLLPVIVGTLSSRAADALAAALKPHLADDVLLVVSSDFIHYGRDFDYEPFPQDTEEKTRALNLDAADAIRLGDTARFERIVDESGATICGREPIRAALRMLPDRCSGRVLHYATSSDESRDFSRFVCYCSIGFHAEYPPAPVRNGDDAEADPEGLSSGDKSFLLDLARRAIQYAIDTRMIPTAEALGVNPDELSPALRKNMGAFVTLSLRQNHRLRGCIGEIQPFRPLWKAVLGRAVDAAFRDPRFLPLTAQEFTDVEIEISALTPAVPVGGWRDIVIGRHGMTLSKNGRSAVFLPQVAPEQGWGIKETLTHLSMKAGLPPDAWREGASFTVFEAIVFHE